VGAHNVVTASRRRAHAQDRASDNVGDRRGVLRLGHIDELGFYEEDAEDDSLALAAATGPQADPKQERIQRQAKGTRSPARLHLRPAAQCSAAQAWLTKEARARAQISPRISSCR
jgi:hypothetical protein